MLQPAEIEGSLYTFVSWTWSNRQNCQSPLTLMKKVWGSIPCSNQT